MKRDQPATPAILESQYVAPHEVSPASLAQSLRSLLPIQSHPIRKQRVTVLDTFDGRVRRAGAQLTRSGRNGSTVLTWQGQSGGSRLTVPLKRPAHFAWECPEGPLQRVLESTIGVRRLLEQVDAETSGALLDVLDERGKTVARLRIESGQARMPSSVSWHQLPTMVTLTGLRGYEEVYQRLVPVVESRPGVDPCPDGLYDVMLRRVGAPVQGVDESPSVDHPDVPADRGTRLVLLALLETLIANEPGLRANLDSEFLHDFRVAVRRTRSLLGQIKRVLPGIVVEHFAGEFSWLGRVTGPPRDLDVLVLALRGEREEFGSDGLDEVLTYLEREQQREHQRLVEALDTNRYQRLRREWRAFLGEPPSPVPEAANAKRPFIDVISHRAWRLTRRIGTAAAAIDGQTEPAQIHEVRILAKKLRYLVDVAPRFFNADDLVCVLDSLKKAQKVLGNFNDAEVQEKHLLASGRGLGAEQGSPGAVLLLGRLAERSRQRRENMRQIVIDELRRFGARETRSACRRAFKRDASKEPSKEPCL